jgi:hypothetical protein
MASELKSIRKETAVAYFKVGLLLLRLPGGTEEDQSQNNRSSGRHLKPGFFEHEAGVLTTQQLRCYMQL